MRLAIFIIVALPITVSARDIDQQAFSWALNNCQSIAIAMPRNAQLEKRLNAVASEEGRAPVKFFYQPVGSKSSVHGHGLSYDKLSTHDLPDKTRFVATHLAWHLSAPEYMHDCP